MMHEKQSFGYRLCPDSYHNYRNSDTSKNNVSIVVILEEEEEVVVVVVVVVTVLAIAIIMPIPSLSLWSLMRISA